jgi:3-deoxy-D-manno-octulosonic-acid transferase
MPLPEQLYEAAWAAARPGVRAAALVSGKLRRGVDGRSDSARRFREWGETERSADRPLVWVHAPSVGEGLMAQAILAELRTRRPDAQVAFTHFSPSAERIVAEVGADVHGYVPWDTRGAVRPVLAALRPTALVFIRTEVWPVLAREAAATGARLLLVNAVLSAGSGRLSRPARGFMAAVYRRLDLVGAVSAAHAGRYEELGVPAGRIRVTGDARFDQVWARIEGRGLHALRGQADAAARVPEPIRPIWSLLHDPSTFTVVAGSTWSADERVLLPPLTVLRRDRRFRVIIAPHEPTPAHLESLERRLDRLSLRHSRLGALLTAAADAPPQVVVVDRMGALADLYALADAAYVGGGFGRSGLHSVVEPAALGVPVLFGPAHGNAREAADLAAHGGGVVVTSAADVEVRLRTYADNPEAAAAAGALARAFVRSETGAAARNAELVVRSLERHE